PLTRVVRRPSSLAGATGMIRRAARRSAPSLAAWSSGPRPKAIRAAVYSRNAPKIYRAQPKRFSAAAPSAMNIPRSRRARRIGSRRTRMWSSRGTAERPIRTTKMNRLSTERLYSVSQPAKNWPAAPGRAIQVRAMPNSTARATTAAVPSKASRRPGSCARRLPTTRSAATRRIRPATVAAQPQRGTSIRSMIWAARRSAWSLAGVQRADLSGPGQVGGSEDADDRAIITDNERVAQGVQRSQDGRPHGHVGQHGGQRLIRRRRHDVRHRGGDVGEARRVTVLGPDGGKLAQRDQPGEPAGNVAGRGCAGGDGQPRPGTFSIEELPDRLP